MAQLYSLTMGLRSAPTHDSQPYNKADINAASKTLRFTTKGMSLFLETNDMNLTH